jgi:hypothetical protein
MITSKRSKWAGNVACTGELSKYEVLVGDVKGKETIKKTQV